MQRSFPASFFGGLIWKVSLSGGRLLGHLRGPHAEALDVDVQKVSTLTCGGSGRPSCRSSGTPGSVLGRPLAEGLDVLVFCFPKPPRHAMLGGAG